MLREHPKTTWGQYQAILEWLNIPANKNLVESAATTGTILEPAALNKQTEMELLMGGTWKLMINIFPQVCIIHKTWYLDILF